MTGCDFRCPEVERVPAPFPLFAVRCRCGTTVLGRTEEETKESWLRHVRKDLWK